MKNEQFLVEQKLKPIFYYDNDVTVCLLVSAPQNNIMARGISICSNRDMFNKRTGRAKALGRAVQAVKRGCDSGSVMPHTLYTTFRVVVADTYPVKSAYLPMPTDYEISLVKRDKTV